MLYRLSVVSQVFSEHVLVSIAIFGRFPLPLGTRPTRIGVFWVTSAGLPK